MSEFIGSRISLVSRSDIRYVGTLHEINSETSTVALEHVSSFGTEGRKDNPDEEIPPSDSVYEYIVFRGSDVKDLRIEEAPAVKEHKPPQMPNDPAILGSGSRPHPSQAPVQTPTQRQNQPQQGTQASSGQSAPLGVQGTQGSQGPSHFAQHSQYPQHFFPPPLPGQWGRGGPVPGPGFPGLPYGAPPNWYPPPGQGFPIGGPFPYGYPPGPPNQHFPQQQKPASISVGTKQQAPGELSAEKSIETKESIDTNQSQESAHPTALTNPAMSKAASTKAAATVTTPPSASGAAAAASLPSIPTAQKVVPKIAPSGPKSGKIVPAVPLNGPVPAKTLPEAVGENTSKPPITQHAIASNKSALDDATQAATAAVAAAMAKLPPLTGQQTNGNATIDNLTSKVKEMRTNDPIRGNRHASSSHRSRGRGGHSHDTAKFEIPTTDFDFESSNAKFNKQDLVKEAIASSPLAENPPNGQDEVIGNILTSHSEIYDKKASFFDDLSSELKDRNEGSDRPGGRLWRGEEQKKNLETFGQGSVDNGYRGSYRGRTRGRGGHRGRGYGGNGQYGIRGGRGGYRGRRGDSQTISQN